MEAQRYLKREPSQDDARSRPFVLSTRGERLLAEVAVIYHELETAWARVLGRRGVEELRANVTRVLRDHHGGGLPPVRPI